MSCRIVLDSPGPFLAGSKIRGNVLCVFKSQEEIRGIILKLIGKEKVFWTQSKTSYREKYVFLSELRLLSREAKFEPGLSVCPFEFTLPENIPSSYGGWFGIIQYTVKVVVDRFWRMDFKHKIRISVYVPQDLNRLTDRSLLEPGVYNADKTVWSWKCTSGFMAMDVNIEKKIFVPDEDIKIGVRVWNKSHVAVQGVKAVLRTIVTSQLSTREASIDDVSVVAETRQDNFVEEKMVTHQEYGDCNERYYEIILKISTHRVPNFTHSRLLSFKSELKVAAILPCFHLNLKKSIPIDLGDIAIGESTERVFSWLRKIGGLTVENLEVCPKYFGSLGIEQDSTRVLI